MKQQPLDDLIKRLWILACEDAALDVDSVLLFPFRGEISPDGFGPGKCWPVHEFVNDGEIPDSADEDLRTNMPSIREFDRVAVWTDRSEEGIAGLMRHELEHVRQFAHHRKHISDSSLNDMYHVALRLVSSSCGGYQLIPMEQDANAAGAMFVRELYGDALIDELIENGHTDRAVFRSKVGPQPLAGLHERMEFFIASFGVSPPA